MTSDHPSNSNPPPLVWDWDIEHADRKREVKADAAIHGVPPFQVDRKLLKDIVKEKVGSEVVRIKFLGSGTFHKGYLIRLVDDQEVVARVARRFMPRLKIESEVATMRYLRERTAIPVPIVYHYDSNPYNRLGGEYIIMSKAAGIPLAKVFHSMSHTELMALMTNMAKLMIPLFGHRFSKIGSLYLGPEIDSSAATTMPTPTATYYIPRSIAITPTTTPENERHHPPLDTQFHLGPIISWPFFGSNRGELLHPTEINRGPWPSTYSYLLSSIQREIDGVVAENEGRSAPHKLHLDPDEILSSIHHKMKAVPGDESDDSDEWDWEESEAEMEGPGASIYRDYRRMQRSTFLVAHLKQREGQVTTEMSRFLRMMEKLGVVRKEHADDGGGFVEDYEEFALDCHDLSLENVFVDEKDHSKVSCIIDWESTTTRPLWACAHVPAFLQSSPFTAKLYRATVEKFTEQSQLAVVDGQTKNLAEIAAEWLHHEATGVRLRMAHRCIEWDGWEEGLVEGILGPEEQEQDWFKSWEDVNSGDLNSDPVSPRSTDSSGTSPTLTECDIEGEVPMRRNSFSSTNGITKPFGRAAVPMVAKVIAVEKEKEKFLSPLGDMCGGRGGELGRRLEAWLTLSGDEEGRVDLGRRWFDGDDEGTVIVRCGA